MIRFYAPAELVKVDQYLWLQLAPAEPYFFKIKDPAEPTMNNLVTYDVRDSPVDNQAKENSSTWGGG